MLVLKQTEKKIPTIAKFKFFEVLLLAKYKTICMWPCSAVCIVIIIISVCVSSSIFVQFFQHFPRFLDNFFPCIVYKSSRLPTCTSLKRFPRLKVTVFSTCIADISNCVKVGICDLDCVNCDIFSCPISHFDTAADSYYLCIFFCSFCHIE